MPKNKKCQFKTNFAKDYTCPELPLEDSNYCIFHKPHKTKGQQKLFKNSINKKLQNKDYVFTGFCFPNITNFASLLERPAPNKPPGFEKDVDFRGSTFERDASFEQVIFHGGADFKGSTFESANFCKSLFNRVVHFEDSIFRRDVAFSRAIFRDWANFKRSTFKGYAAFPATTFQNLADFRGSLFEKYAEPEAPFLADWNAKFADFEESTFRTAYFAKTIFRGWAIFRRSTFKEYADFTGSTFERNAAFEASTFERGVRFKDSIFPGNANFEDSTFKRDADFTGSLFQRDANFAGSTFVRDADFTGSLFQRDANFAGSTFERDAVFENTTFRNNSPAEKTFRIVKNHYQRQGHYTLAGEYYYKERIAKRKQLPWYSPKRWSEYILLDGLCGYGERPLRAIRTGLGVLFGLAFLYWRLGHIYPSPELFNEPHTLTFWDALYFSVVTFTTLGFGDWRPDPSHWIRYIVMSEAFIGAFLMALFIVTFARRMMR